MLLSLFRSCTPIHSAPELLGLAKPSSFPACGSSHPPVALGSWLGHRGVQVCLSTCFPGVAGKCTAVVKVSLSSL